jgi:ParB family chromosome partitioning protein
MSEVKTVRLGSLEHDPVAIAGHEKRLEQLDDLEASIPLKGQLQSLNVRPAGKGAKKGIEWWVKAGNRRLATLRRLRDAKASVLGVVVTNEFPVHVIIKDEGDADAYETSRSENLQRVPETMVEEFRAFARMAETKPPAEIAAVFGVTEKRVLQRLKLAALHPDLLDALEAGKMDMASAQAFTIEPDQKKQLAVWKKLSDWQRGERSIRAALTDRLVRGDSPIAKFITRKAYEKAGGKIHGDAFDEKASYWISPDVIKQCIADAWADKKAKWVEDGWSFVEEASTFGQDNWNRDVAGQLKQMEAGEAAAEGQAAGGPRHGEGRNCRYRREASIARTRLRLGQVVGRQAG